MKTKPKLVDQTKQKFRKPNRIQSESEVVIFHRVYREASQRPLFFLHQSKTVPAGGQIVNPNNTYWVL